ncbi:MAG TPA: T9SS type A sorting domain-containing protein, partial [Ignavibacteria bacterium]|nr:T9SS type A sorting domain-containing protein [Ignavibacteria bacterium]
YPNPFNPTTKIGFNIPSAVAQYIEPVQLVIFDILGREIQTLVNEKLQAGSYEVTFDASKLSSGVYYYKLIAGIFSDTKKMVVVK